MLVTFTRRCRHPSVFQATTFQVNILFSFFLSCSFRMPSFQTILAGLAVLISFQTPFSAQAELPVLGQEGSISAVKWYPTLSPEEIAAGQTVATIPAELKNLTAKSAIILDDVDGTIIFAKEPDQPRQPASTIKVLTGIIALHSLAGDEEVSVSREAASRPSSKMYLDPAKVYRADELISGVLLGSANDASVALAELIAGSESAFAEFMNLQASHFGATNTVCKTATGLTAKDQTSTARDLALIFREAMRDDNFSAKMRIRSITTDEGNTLYNHNKALWRIEGAEGGKTGYTLAARQTYVGKFSNGEATFIVAIMGSETMWQDLKQLVNFGFGQYPHILSARKQNIGTDLVADSDKEDVPRKNYN